MRFDGPGSGNFEDRTGQSEDGKGKQIAGHEGLLPGLSERIEPRGAASDVAQASARAAVESSEGKL